MAKQKNYPIRLTTYKKCPTGELDRFGRKKYETCGAPTVKTINGNFRDLKVSEYKKAKADPSYFANFKTNFVVTPKTKLVSTTKVFSDGTIEKTFINPGRFNSGK